MVVVGRRRCGEQQFYQIFARQIVEQAKCNR
jgi:hypothetical protein